MTLKEIQEETKKDRVLQKVRKALDTGKCDNQNKEFLQEVHGRDYKQ